MVNTEHKSINHLYQAGRFTGFLLMLFSEASGQYWQQESNYKMDIRFDEETHRFAGLQELEYTNHSTDTLEIVFYHLYFNAFQPNSLMDLRSRSIADPDLRIGDRISKLSETETGYQRIVSLEQDGKPILFETDETILKVRLDKPIEPGASSLFTMKFEAQVPLQIRRCGRNNIEGIAYSMSQWYPKMAEYDRSGWHSNQYIAREFYGVWGNFDVTIDMDSSYTIAATGVLRNPSEIGKGYGAKTAGDNSDRLKWHFVANNVHDFVWAADQNYLHDKVRGANDIEFHFFYKNDSSIIHNWKKLPAYTIRCFELMNRFVGPYPYSVYSVIQGGDGGMEYPMATLILGGGKLKGLVSVTVHEAIHSWFQGLLGTDEGHYPWMDEGFDTYFNHLVIDSLFNINNPFPHSGSYSSLLNMVEKGLCEPLSTHSDLYTTNHAYGVNAYAKGCILLNELNYIIGEENFEKAIKTYFSNWIFKHPSPSDFKNIFERISGLNLDWYFNLFLNTCYTSDYEITDLIREKKSTVIVLRNNGKFPMPVDLTVTLKSDSVFHYTIPLRMMLGAKKSERNIIYQRCEEWPWTHKDYTLRLPFATNKIRSVIIDEGRRMADSDRSNNVYPVK